MNLKRSPLCGRNFEYFSEDPLLAGKLGAAWVRGLQSAGPGACVKHFACNSQEHKRFASDSVLDERTLRELYLTAFEIVVRESRPAAVMSAYNKINGVHCAENRELLSDILREEWGFDGAVVTDWGGMSDRIAAFGAGCDLMMPGGSGYMAGACRRAAEAGALDGADLDRSARRVPGADGPGGEDPPDRSGGGHGGPPRPGPPGGGGERRAAEERRGPAAPGREVSCGVHRPYGRGHAVPGLRQQPH